MLFKLGWTGYAALGYTIRGVDLLKQKWDSIRSKKDTHPDRLRVRPSAISDTGKLPRMKLTSWSCVISVPE
jgi:hypothetical protein